MTSDSIQAPARCATYTDTLRRTTVDAQQAAVPGWVCCKARHLLTKLSVDLVRDSHNSDQEQAAIDASQVVLQSTEDTYL